MIEFLQNFQLGLMVALAGVCITFAALAGFSRTLPKKRKIPLVYIELSAGLMLLFDRLAYFYKGDPSATGGVLVRVSNFFVFFLMICYLHALNLYLRDLALTEMGLKKIPRRLRIVEILALIGWILVVASQFLGFYYTIDAQNNYQRGDLFFLSYVVPFLIVALQFSLLVNYYKRLSRGHRISLVLFFMLPVIAAVIQYYFYGLSLINISLVGTSVLLYLFAQKESADTMSAETRTELDTAIEEKTIILHAFIQAATAIANAVDVRDEYCKGHSERVAKYSRMIAERAGLDAKTCDEAFFSGLLHDIGKVSISDSLLKREHAPTEADKEIFKQHTRLGAQILASISDYPYLQDAALHHHERFDGTGYPDGLKGEKIPLYARIVTVADVYDSMTSPKRTRGPMPQGRVRELLISGAGKQFDPRFSATMVEIIDQDTDYKFQAVEDSDLEGAESVDLTKVKQIKFGDYKGVVSDGLKIVDSVTNIHLRYKVNEGAVPKNSLPAIILFDAFDGCVHKDDRKIRNLHYLEFAEIWFDGNYISTKARNMKVDIIPRKDDARLKKDKAETQPSEYIEYDIEASRYKDHVRITIETPENTIDTIVALPDSARSSFISIAGENCTIDKVNIETTDIKIGEYYIPRIADELSIVNLLDADIPNIQADNRRSAESEGVQIDDGLRLAFHSKTLPSANLVSSCPYVIIYTADDGRVHGKNYRECACIRLDGEDVTEGEHEKNTLEVIRGDNFDGWDAWKTLNKKGFECEVEFKRRRNKVSFATENGGIMVSCTVPIEKGTNEVYAALTGEACAIMDIRARY